MHFPSFKQGFLKHWLRTTDIDKKMKKKVMNWQSKRIFRSFFYTFLLKSNQWSIINAAFWLFELLLGYML